MIRGLISLVALLAAGVLGALYSVYGEVEPCRVLAKEYTYRDLREGSLLDAVGFDIEKMHRANTSQHTMGECSGMLIDAWVERLGGSS